jgi:putative transposase
LIKVEPRRPNSLRLKDYDYSLPGAYYFTTCMEGRSPVLSRVEHHHLELTPLGMTVLDAWNYLPTKYTYLQLDCIAIMPEHVHAICLLSGDDMPVGAYAVHNPGAGQDPAPTHRPTLSSIVRTLKSISARAMNVIEGTEGQTRWQRGFNDHIVRPNDKDLERIREYILNNPMQLLIDKGVRLF